MEEDALTSVMTQLREMEKASRIMRDHGYDNVVKVLEDAAHLIRYQAAIIAADRCLINSQSLQATPGKSVE